MDQAARMMGVDASSIRGATRIGNGTYYVNITEPGDWLETGGTSPWSNGTIKGYLLSWFRWSLAKWCIPCKKLYW